VVIHYEAVDGRSHLHFIGCSSGRRSVTGVEDLTRLGLLLISAPIAVVAGGVLLGVIGRWISGHRDG